jgi:hypothetical protein
MTRSLKTPEGRSRPQSGAQTPKVEVRPVEGRFLTATLMRALLVRQSSGPRSTVRYADDRCDTSGAPR